MAGPGSIPWTAINEYGARYDFDGYDFDRLVYFVGLLDGVFLESIPKDGKNKSKPPKA